MATTALREIVIGVRDVPDRARFFERALGLVRLASGFLEPETAALLAGVERPLEAVVLGRPDVSASPRLRLVAGSGPPPRAGDVPFREAGPLGIGFTTRGVTGVHARLAEAGVAFASEPLRLTPETATAAGPVRYEAFGRGPDGDGVVLIERVNTPTPYGTLSEGWDVSEPLHVSIVVSDLEASSRFLRAALGHVTVFAERCEGPLFERLMALTPGTRFRFEMLKHPGFDTGRAVLIEFEGEPPIPATEPLGSRAGRRGIVALRYDTDDLDTTLAAALGAGAALVKPPAEIDAPLVGRARLAVVQPPWEGRVELWQPASRTAI